MTKSQKTVATLGLTFTAGAVLVIALCFVASCLGGNCGAVLSATGIGPEVTLPVLAIAGVLVLLVALALIAIAYSSLDLTDRQQALGLPEGSVRAVIALSLIVLFAILGVFLYASLATSGKISVVTGITPDQLKQFQQSLPSGQIVLSVPSGTSQSLTYSVYYREIINPASEDFAKQLLILIGAAVTSLTGFYFGARTATSAASAASSGTTQGIAPTLRAIDPNTIARGAQPTPVQLSGESLDLIKEVKIVLGADQVVATDVLSNASVVKCQLALTTASPAGSWDVIATDGVGRKAQLSKALTVT